MTFAHIWFGTMAVFLSVWLVCYFGLKILWPTLRRNKWVLHEWEGWR